MMDNIEVGTSNRPGLDYLVNLSDEAFRTICDRIPAIVAIYSIENGNYIYINLAVKKLLGYRPEEILEGGLEFALSIVHPDDLPKMMAKNLEAIETANKQKPRDASDEIIASFDYRMRHKKGHWVWLHTDGSVFSRKNGKVENILNVSIDISDHKNLEVQLDQNNNKIEIAERFALSQKAAKVGTFEISVPDRKVRLSPELEQLFGLEAGEFKGNYDDWIKLVHPEDRKKKDNALRQAIKGTGQFNDEFRIVCKNGETRWMLGRGELIKDLKGKPITFIGVNVDITDRKEIEVKLRASEERYQAFIKNSSEGIWLFELEKPIPINLPPEKQVKLMYKRAYLAEANDLIANMYGVRSVNDIIGARLPEFMIESDPKNTEYLEAFIKSGYSLSNTESHEKDAAGNDKYFLNSLVGIIEDGHLLRAWGTQHDITEQRIANAALRKSEERLSLAIKASKLGLWEWNILTGELEWSSQLKKLYGLKASDKISFEKFMQLIHPEDRLRIQHVIEDGLNTGKSYQVEHRVVWPDGSVHWLLAQGQALIKNKKPTHVAGTSTNIDERKAVEEIKLKVATLSAEHKELMEINRAKDEFIAITSHQLRTPATGVKQYVGLLLQGYADKITKTQETFLEKAYESNERQLQIIDELLRIVQLDLNKITPIKQNHNISKLIQESIEDLTGKFEERDQKIEFKRPAEKIRAKIDYDLFHMVLDNLLENASNYSPDGKTITVILGKNKQNETYITIKDEGVGIDRSDFPKLFQKFSRIDNPLSNSVNGSGLGLYLVKKIIDLHGGYIRVKSDTGKGTAFKVILPTE